MKIRPILFSTPMVPAILEGRKTQTRRVIKDKTEHVARILMKDGLAVSYVRGAGAQLWEDSAFKCPYGQVGDVLWVRETFLNFNPVDQAPEYIYKAENPNFGMVSGEKWKPSIFMPKDAARIWLRITNVRVERLHEITEEDAIREGSKYLLNVREWFADLWKSINGEESWKSNPWVWVVEFERIEKPIEL